MSVAFIVSFNENSSINKQMREICNMDFSVYPSRIFHNEAQVEDFLQRQPRWLKRHFSSDKIKDRYIVTKKEW